ncbi:MAG: dihydroorotate dehydrogenase [Halobacteriales archaeon]|nr:dihydroorotate dehydrogenase [Halobacteriales archaeon]
MQVEISGVELTNPVLLASGILGSTGESLNRALRSGAGGVVTKSVGPREREGHPGPNVFVDDSEEYALNAVGLSNPSDAFTDEVEKVDGPTVVSVFGGTAEEFAEAARTFEPYADAFELNVSCPHAEGYGVDIGADPELTRRVTAAVSDAVEQPVWVKLTPNVADVVAIGESAQEGGADAVVATNTLSALAIDVESGRPILGNVHGGMSGSALKPVAVRCVYDLYEALDVPVVGVGGVSSPEDAVEYMLAGASAVEVGTAVWDGIDVLGEIAEGVEEYKERKGLSHDELVGRAHELAPKDDAEGGEA